jgi:hypothetical protein
LPQIAAQLGLTLSALRWRAAKWGWTRPTARRPKRRPRPAAKTAKPSPAKPSPAKPAAAKSSPAEAPPADFNALTGAVRSAVEAEIVALQARVAAGEGGEATARTLASLARTLSALSQIENKAGQDAAHDDNAPPLDLAQLRRELAERLDRLREQRRPSETS